MTAAITESMQPRPRTCADWAGIFDTVKECDVTLRDIEGTLPPGLVGTLYRNGPARHDFGASFFDGDGMIRALRIEPDGSVRYRARYIGTDKYLRERDSAKPLCRTAGTNLPGGFLRNMFRVPAHEANTSVFSFGGGLWALEEGGHPYAIDPRSLETGGLNDYGGALHSRTAFTAHPHIDPSSGETFAFGTHFGGRKPELRTFRIDARGTYRDIGTIPLEHMSFVHDYGLSKKWMAFFIPPMVGNLFRFLFGLDTFFDAIAWRPELGMKVLLMSRDGGEPIFLETDTAMAGHVIAAWDEGDELVVDMCQLENWSQMGDAAAEFRTSDWPGFGASSVWRYRIDPMRGKVRGEMISDMPAEFPEINSEAECRKPRFAYFASNRFPGEGGIFRGVLKRDYESGTTQFHDFGDTKVSLQPTFVSRPDANEEDDGWIMTIVHDGATKTTEIPILDARAIQDGPICTLRLQENAGITFHGCWIPG